MRILVIVGGMNEPSNSDYLADRFIEGAKEISGMETDKVRLKDLNIHHFTLRCYDSGFQPEPDYARLEAAVKAADGVVYACPVWNFDIPGHMKNMIDRFGAFGLDRETRTQGQWKGKPHFLIFTGGAPHAAWIGLQKRTTSSVPVSIRYFGGTVTGTHFEPRSLHGKGQFGLVVDKRPESIEKVRREGKRFGEIVKKYAETGALPATQTFLKYFFAIGQKIQRRI